MESVGSLPEPFEKTDFVFQDLGYNFLSITEIRPGNLPLGTLERSKFSERIHLLHLDSTFLN